MTTPGDDFIDTTTAEPEVAGMPGENGQAQRMIPGLPDEDVEKAKMELLGILVDLDRVSALRERKMHLLGILQPYL